MTLATVYRHQSNHHRLAAANTEANMATETNANGKGNAMTTREWNRKMMRIVRARLAAERKALREAAKK